MSHNLEDIARIAGVSRSTVSRVINNHPNVSEKTRRKVIEVVEREGYIPNLAARTLVTRRTQVLGFATSQVLAEVFTHPYFATVIQGMLDAANQHSYAVMLWVGESTEEKQRFYDRVRYTRFIDGLVIASLIEGDPFPLQLVEEGFPFVIIGHSPCDGLNSVDVDNVRAARTATEHLIRLGYRRVGTITGRRDHGAGQDRLCGYLEAMRAAGRDAGDELVVDGDFSEMSGYTGMKVLLQRGADAVFCASDLMAIGALHAVHEHGLRVPDDVALVGFDDQPLAAAVDPPLTTMRQPIRQMGSLATEVLINILEGRLSTPYRAILPTELIVRKSCGASRR